MNARASALQLLAIAALSGVSSRAAAQATEIWPEIDLYWRQAESHRSLLELSTSTEREGTKREGSVGLYHDYLFLPRGYLRAGYRFTFSIRDRSYRESRIVLESTLARDLSAVWHLANRARVEPRWVNGEFSYRLRERLHLQRERRPARARSVAPYGTAEAYYDSRYRTIAKLGARLGAVWRVRATRALDAYVAHQANSRGQPRRIDALGLTASLTF